MIGRALGLPDQLKNDRFGIGLRFSDTAKPELIAGRERDRHFIILFRHSFSPKKRLRGTPERRGLIKKFERQHGNSGFRDICRLKHGRIAEIAVFIAEFGTKAAGAAAEHRLGRDGQIADAFSEAATVTETS